MEGESPAPVPLLKKTLSAANLKVLGDESDRRMSLLDLPPPKLGALSDRRDSGKSQVFSLSRKFSSMFTSSRVMDADVDKKSDSGTVEGSHKFSMFMSRRGFDDDKKSETGTLDGSSNRFSFRKISMFTSSKSIHDHDDKSSTNGGHSSKSHHINKGKSKSGWGWFGGVQEEEEDGDRSSVPTVDNLHSIREKRGEIEVRKLHRMKKRGQGDEFWRKRGEAVAGLPLPDLEPTTADYGDSGPQVCDPITARIDAWLLTGHAPQEAPALYANLTIQETIKARDAPKYSIVALDGTKKVPPKKPIELPPGYKHLDEVKEI